MKSRIFECAIALIVLVIWAVMVMSNAKADTLILSGASYHLGEYEGYCTDGSDLCNDDLFRPYNEANYGLGYEVNVNSWANMGVMAYENSFHSLSAALYANVRHEMKVSENASVEVSARIGIVSGYDLYNEKIMPFVQPAITVWYKQMGLELGILPSDTTALTLAYKVRWQ